MSKLGAGAHAPNFRLHDVEGKPHALDAHANALSLAIFFRTACPTCQYAWKYFERLHTAYAKAGLRVLGISQHDAEETRKFGAQYATTFPLLLDDSFAVSRQYDPAVVPTGFLIDSQGKIVETFESWNSQRLNEFSERVAQRLGIEAQPVVLPQDNAAPNKIG